MKIKDFELKPLPQEKMKNNYFLYCRKSSESEDKQAASIDSQIELLTRLAQQKGITIVEQFTESKSAKAPGRPEFNRMISSIQKRDDIKGIVSWQLNRLSRNPIDTATIQWLLQQGQIIEIVTPARTYVENDSDLIMGLEGSMANRFIRELKANTQRGINRKLENGMYPGLAPAGYVNNVNMRQGEKTVTAHPIYFKLMRKIFKMAMSGQYSTTDLIKKAKELGIRNGRGQPISKSRMYELLRNPFYAGRFIYAKKMYQGSHEPMLSIKEFDAVQEVLEGKANPRKKIHNFPLKGFARCGHCGYGIVFEQHIKKSGLIFEYATCCKKKKGECVQGFIPASELEEQVSEYLENMSVSDDFVTWASKWLKHVENQDRDIRQTSYQGLRNEHRELELKLNNLTDKWLEGGKLSDEEYKDHKQRYIQRMYELDQDLKEQDEDLEIWTDLTIETFKFARTAQERWKYGSLEDKKTILNVLGSNLILKDKKLGITPITPFLLIKNAVEEIKPKTNGSNPPIEADIREDYVSFPALGPKR